MPLGRLPKSTLLKCFELGVIDLHPPASLDPTNIRAGCATSLWLSPAYTKGGASRTIFVNKRLQREIRRELDSYPALPAPESALLPSQKGRPFLADSLRPLFAELYRRAGIDGASSHSGRRGPLSLNLVGKKINGIRYPRRLMYYCNSVAVCRPNRPVAR